MNDNVLMTNAVICLADGKRARGSAMSPGHGYLNSMVSLYHSTMPKMPGAIIFARHAPPPAGRVRARLRDRGRLPAVRHARPGALEQMNKYQAVGTDQLVFGIPNEGFEHEEVLR